MQTVSSYQPGCLHLRHGMATRIIRGNFISRSVALSARRPLKRRKSPPHPVYASHGARSRVRCFDHLMVKYSPDILPSMSTYYYYLVEFYEIDFFFGQS